MNKEVKTLNKILGDSICLSYKVIFLYNGFDCEACIDNGYAIVNKIDSISKKQIVYTISTSANKSRDQLKNNYFNYVFEDGHDLVRRELKYIYTPVLLKLDSSNKIRDVYFPIYVRDLKSENEFIKKCIDN
ncbi:MAG: hypothetical protein MI975_06890 [Cytophagales bacterium]|nr:hypothetical protein [Cytophagales bacterium]